MSKPNTDAVKSLKVTACLCVYCGESVAYGPSLTDDAILAVQQSMIAHDAVCEKNPLRAALAAAEAKLAEQQRYTESVFNAMRDSLMAKLANERKHALVTLHALAGCVEWMGEDGCDCGSDDPRCALCEAQAVIEKCAARRAAEVGNG